MVLSVLVVEPYADFRSEIVALLTREHYRCDGAASAHDAMLKIRDHDYAYILLDIDQAGAPDLLASHPIGEVILISENTREGDGRYAVLRKPFARDELLASLTAPRR